MVCVILGGGPREGQFDDIVFTNLDVGDAAPFEKELVKWTLLDVRRKGK